MNFLNRVATVCCVFIASNIVAPIASSATDGIETMSTTATLDALDQLWDNMIGDNSFQADWFQTLLDENVSFAQTSGDDDSASSNTDSFDPDSNDDSFPGSNDDSFPGSNDDSFPGSNDEFFPGDADDNGLEPWEEEESGELDFSCLAGNVTSGTSKKQVKFPVIEVSPAAREEMYRRKAVLNLFLGRADKYDYSSQKTDMFANSDSFFDTDPPVASEISSQQAEIDRFMARKISAEAELFLISLIDYFSATSLETKCDKIKDANIHLGSIPDSVLLFKDETYFSPISESLSGVFQSAHDKFTNDKYHDFACKAKTPRTKQQTKLQIMNELDSKLKGEFSRLVSNYLILIDNSGLPFDVGDIKQAMDDISDSAKTINDLEMDMANAKSNMEMVATDALQYKTLNDPSNSEAQSTKERLVNINWSELSDLYTIEPEPLAEMKTKVEHFKSLIEQGIEGLVQVEAEYHNASSSYFTCAKVKCSFKTYTAFLGVSGGSESGACYIPEAFSPSISFKTVRNSFLNSFDDCLDDILMMSQNVTNSTLDTRITAEFGKHLSTLTQCVAIKQNDRNAKCGKVHGN